MVFVIVLLDSMEMDVNLKNVQMIVALMEYVIKMVNAYVTLIFRDLIAQKKDVKMIGILLI